MAAVVAALCAGCEPQIRQNPSPVQVSHKLEDRPPVLKVSLGERLRGKDVPTLTVSGPVQFKSLSSGALLGSAASLSYAPIDNRGAQLAVGPHRFSEKAVLVDTGAGIVQVGGKSYRGDLEVWGEADGSVSLVNRVDLESYLMGVVASEMPKEWPAQALAAQAVASRTYAYAMLTENRSSQSRYAMTADFRTAQVYKGLAGEAPTATVAVTQTRGNVLTYNGQPFRAYFHSCCGGHTEACGLIWEDYATIGPLTGVTCPYCTHSKWYQPWTVQLKAAEIQKALTDSGREVGAIRDIKLTDMTQEGHADVVEVFHTGGRLMLRGNDFRLAVGPGKLRSLMCQVSRQGDTYVFTGRGFGHGAGMCQYGAQGMANQGRSWKDIVLYYYPGSQVWTIYS